jgi:hypothetical protein
MEDKQSIKEVLESQGDVHEKVANQSNYARKFKEITFPMELVSCPTKIGVVRNHSKEYRFSKPFLVLRHYFGPMGRVSSWSPLGMRPRVRP